MTAIRRVALVHAMNSTLDDHWYRSFLAAMESAGLDVVAPAMPSPREPDAGAWQATLDEAVGAVDVETAIVAHSVGNPAALRYLTLLGESWTLGALVDVGGFSDPQPGNPATIPFTVGIDHARVRDRTIRRHAFIGLDDPKIPNGLSLALADRLDSTVHRVEDAGHFRGEDGYDEFPALVDLVTGFARESTPTG